jgi:hypothetical protein
MSGWSMTRVRMLIESTEWPGWGRRALGLWRRGGLNGGADDAASEPVLVLARNYCKPLPLPSAILRHRGILREEEGIKITSMYVQDV